jgi:hypothetical protein
MNSKGTLLFAITALLALFSAEGFRVSRPANQFRRSISPLQASPPTMVIY